MRNYSLHSELDSTTCRDLEELINDNSVQFGSICTLANDNLMRSGFASYLEALNIDERKTEIS